MKKLSKKGLLLFAGPIAVGAFLLPSMASASSWGPVGSHHVLDSPDFGFTSVIAGVGATSSCTSSSFTARVVSAADLSISGGSLGGFCTAIGGAIGTCTVTTATTGFPWRATAVTTSNIQIHGIHSDYVFENAPGLGNSCPGLVGFKMTITGTVIGGRWTGNGAGQHSLDFVNAAGLVSHSALGNNVPIAVRAFVADTQGTLTVS